MCLKKSCLLLLLTTICLAFGQFKRLDPSPSRSSVDVLVCLGSMPVFVCNTTEGSLLWETSSTVANCVYDEDLLRESPKVLGYFILHRDGVFVSNATTFATAVNSTAMLAVPVQLSHDGVTLKCYENTDFNQFSEIILNVEPPPAPIVTSITQSSTNSSSLLISWSMSDCAVQYVVTIINSSDGSVYLNITTSDTNITVTLPTGVEYCVTVHGMDSINRTGPPSQQQCYPIVPTSTVSVTSTVYLKSTAISVSDSSPTSSPEVGGINVAAVAVPIVMVVIAAVGCVIVILVIYLVKRKKKGISPECPIPTQVQLGNIDIKVDEKVNNMEGETEMGIQQTHPNACSPAPPTCMCQVFYYRMKPNHWRVVFTFFPINLEDMVNMNKPYHDADERAPPIENFVIQDKRVKLKYPTEVIGWKISVTDNVSSVERASIEEYSGDKNKLPNVELVVVPQGDTKTYGDLNITVTLMGIIPSSPITIFKTYEPQQIEQPESQEQLPTEQGPRRQSFTELQPASGDASSEAMQCVCQVFYLKDKAKWWNVKFAFCYRAYLDDMKAFYHNANAIIGECIDVQFKTTSEPIYALSKDNDKMKNVWNLICYLQKKVTAAEVRRYIGEGEPPHCEANLGAVSDNTTLDAEFAVTLHGAQPPNNTITVTSAIEPPTEYTPTNPQAVLTDYVSQVFYQQQGVNVWIVTFSFFHKRHLEEVKKLYPYEDVGPTINIQLKNKQIKLSAGRVKLTATDGVTGWSYEFHHKKVNTAAVEQYTGEGDPPYCEMTLKGAMPDGSTPPDLTLPINITGVKESTTITLKRDAQKSLEHILGNSEYVTDSFNDTKYLCGVFYHKMDVINHWEATIAFFPEHKHQKVSTVCKSKDTGPTAEFEFKRGSSSSVKVGFKKPISKEWKVVVSPKHEKVKKAAVDAFGHSGKYDEPPYCEMILRAVSDSTTLPDLTVSLVLTGGRLLEPITLERKAEHLSLSSPDSNNQGNTGQDPKSLESNEKQTAVQASSTTLSGPTGLEPFIDISLPADSQPADTCMQSAMDHQEDEDRTDIDIKNAKYRTEDSLPITPGYYDN